MTYNEVKPLIYQVNSIPHLYKGLSETDLKLEIYEYGRDALEVKLINKNYLKQRRLIKRHLCFLSACSFAYIMASFLKPFHLIYIDILFILWLVPLLWHLLNLVESEKFIYCYDFGLHLQVQKLVGKHNSFIAASNIQDIVINEVLENIFKPSWDCLSLTYEYINKIMLKTSTNFT